MAGTNGRGAAERAARRAALRERTIIRLHATLKNAFTIYENDGRLKEDPEAWIRHTIRSLHRAHCMLDQRRSHPELRGALEQLEAAIRLAERRLPVFAERKGITVTFS